MKPALQATEYTHYYRTYTFTEYPDFYEWGSDDDLHKEPMDSTYLANAVSWKINDLGPFEVEVDGKVFKGEVTEEIDGNWEWYE